MEVKLCLGLITLAQSGLSSSGGILGYKSSMFFVQVILLISGVASEFYRCFTDLANGMFIVELKRPLAFKSIETKMLPHGTFGFSGEVINLLVLFFCHVDKRKK